jgi:hypothetical protein
MEFMQALPVLLSCAQRDIMRRFALASAPYGI